MSLHRNLYPNREQSIRQSIIAGSPGGESGSGNDAHAPVGRVISGVVQYIYRELVRYGLDWSNVYRIRKAWLWVRSTSPRVHIDAPLTNSLITVQRLASAFAEGGGGEGSWRVDAATVYPGPGVTGSAINAVLPVATATWSRIDITAFLDAWAPDRVKQSDGSPGAGATNFGIRFRGTNESQTDHAFEFNSHRGGHDIESYIELIFDTPASSDAPVLTKPATLPGGLPQPVPSRKAKFASFKLDKPPTLPPGSFFRRWRVQIFGQSATDGSPGTPLFDRTYAADANTKPRSVTVSVTDDKIQHKTLRARVQIQVENSSGALAWSPWTSLTDALFKTLYQPYAPVNIYFQRTTTDSPIIAASIRSEDPGDYATAMEVEITKHDVAGGSITMYAPGPILTSGTPTRVEIPYSGQPIATTDQLRFRIRMFGRDAGPYINDPDLREIVAGDWSPTATQTFTSVTGPTDMDPVDRNTKLLSPRGPFTVGDAAEFDELVANFLVNGQQVYTTGLLTFADTLSYAITLPVGVLKFGDSGEWEAQIRHVGASSLEPLSPRYQFQVDTLPATTITAEGRTSKGVVGTLNPLWLTPYLDPDVAAYGEVPVAKELLIRVAASPALSGSLVERRAYFGGVLQEELTGQQLDPHTSAAGATADSNVTATTAASQPSGYSGNSLLIQLTGTSSTNRGARVACAAGALDLSLYGGGARIWLKRKVHTTTNVTRWVARFLCPDTSNYFEYSIWEAGDTADAFAEISRAKDNPRATTGSPDWALWDGEVKYVAVLSGNSTSELTARDLRIGTTLTGKTTPDGHLAFGSSYDATARFLDDATPKASTTLAAAVAANASNIKAASVANIQVGDDITVVTAGAIETRTVVTVGTSGSGGTGITVSQAFTYAHASADPARVYFWGPWAAVETDQFEEPPVVEAISPAADAVVNDPTVDFVHTYSSDSASPQVQHVLHIYQPNEDDEDELVRETVLNDADTTETAPRFLLDDLSTYRWDVTVTDEHGLTATTERLEFTTDFTPPDAPTGLAADTDPSIQLIELSWDASGDDFSDHTRVYWRNARGQWVRIDGGPSSLDDGKTPLTDTTLQFYGGRQGLNEFRVTFDNGAVSDDESDPTQISVRLDAIRPAAWSIVLDGNDQFTFAFDADDAPRTSGSSHERFDPPGRLSPLLLNWGRTGRHWSIGLTYRPGEDGDLDTLFEILFEAGISFWLKWPEGYSGDPLRVVLVGKRANPVENGEMRIQLELDESFSGAVSPIVTIDITPFPADIPHLSDLVWEDEA